MKAIIFNLLLLTLMISIFISCSHRETSHQEMIYLLTQGKFSYDRFDNYYAANAQVKYYDSLIRSTSSAQDIMLHTYRKARALIALGEEEQAVSLLEPQVAKIDQDSIKGMDKLKVLLALAHLRAGERANCVVNHTSETCILPIQGSGIHKITTGSRNAVGLYTQLLNDYPDNMEYRWLLNIAYMTLGEYPQQVPQKFLIPGLDAATNNGDSAFSVNAFTDLAGPLSLDVNNMAGGSIVDDFDNDGYLDIVTSGWGLDDEMHFFGNNADGTFTDKSEQSKLKQLTGGLNLLQMDFNNDGFKDIFVLRGAWLRDSYCKQPNSLIRNNGDGTFTDITTQSGLLSFHPTQTATWNDFNNDGWIDVFIGNESWEGNASSGLHPAELYINNRGETFVNVAREAGCDITGFVKGVTSGDYDNDGWKDIFASSLSGQRYLLRNKGVREGIPSFENVTKDAGLANEVARTFPTWFWDYDNDGWLDIFVGDFTFDKPITSYSAAEALGLPFGSAGSGMVYQNNHDGTFTNVSKVLGLSDKTAFAMGANFGDIDNDGYLDFYLGTGNPELESIVPNKLFKNHMGKRFVDITTPARVGHLQKGHAISFADLDNDGDQDIYIEVGGAYRGDAFHNSFYVNPGQDERNRWIALDLVGMKANRAAIGSRIKIIVKENGKTRTIYRDVNSGGSFGASPLRKEIGIGRAEIIDEIEIQWHPGSKQIFKNIKPNRFLRIREGNDVIEEISLRPLDFTTKVRHEHHHTSN
jgi:hypothetical protein